MNTSKISVRYAKALLNLAIEEQKQERINDDIKLVFDASLIPELDSMLENPVILPTQKKAVINSLFSGKVDVLTVKFIEILISNKRESHLKNISRTFLSLYRKKYGIKAVNLTTASKINKKTETEISEIISNNFKVKVELETEIDKEVIGGFIMKIEDKQYDASISSKLNKVRRELLDASLES